MGNSNSIELFEEGELEKDFKTYVGHEDISVWGLFKKGYEDIIESIIRPKRRIYSIDDLGLQKYMLDSVTNLYIYRNDLEIVNKQGLKIVCSHWQPAEECRVKKNLPCIIYTHSNIGSRMDALRILKEALLAGFTLFAFDFCGSGMSDGMYVTLSNNEKEDLECVTSYLSQDPTISQLCIWGHSMGAVTAILHSAENPNIEAMVLDGAFSTLSKLAAELMVAVQKEGVYVPQWVMQTGYELIRSSIQSRAKFDLNTVRPIDSASKCDIPALFLTGNQDKYVPSQHCDEIISKYNGPASQLRFEGDHYGVRPRGVISFGLVFLIEALQTSKNKKNNPIVALQ